MPSMSMNDPEYLKEQYKDSTNIQARIDFHRRFSLNKYGWHPWVFDQLDLPPRCRILELGCGPGALWEENLARIPPGWDITLSDFSSGMLEGTWRKFEKLRPFQYKVIDAQSIPYGSSTFDAVIANHMLFFVSDRPAALREIHRVLNPSGHFYATTNSERNMIEIAALLAKFDPALGDWGTVSAPFSLENGAPQLSPWFTDIQLDRYEDALDVTDDSGLEAFILSGWAATIIGDRRDQFREFLSQEMEVRGGHFRVSKDGGLFTAVRKGVGS